MATALGFMTKGIHAALRAQVRVGTGLEVIVVTRRTGFVVAWWARTVVAWTAVVKLARWALALRTVAVAWGAVTELFGAFAFAWRTVTHTVTAHMAVGARGTTAFTTLAATA